MKSKIFLLAAMLIVLCFALWQMHVLSAKSKLTTDQKTQIAVLTAKCAELESNITPIPDPAKAYQAAWLDGYTNGYTIGYTKGNAHTIMETNPGQPR